MIRGLAILLVLLRHSWPAVFGTAGMVGVVVFFALSGYLITGLLVSDLQRFGRVRYGRFYRNRALRLLPALLLMLAGFAVVSLIWDPLGDKGTVPRSLIVGITYTMNIPFDHGSAALSHLWTLATEEQFYLVWPLLLAVGMRYRKVRAVLVAAAGLIVLVMIATMTLTAPTIWRIYPLPTSWCIAMVIGAAGYFTAERLNGLLRRTTATRIVSGIVAIGVVLGLASLPEAKGAPTTYLIVGPLAAAATVVLVAHLRTWVTLPTVWLQPLRALGLISYAAYLWNYPIHTWIDTNPSFPAPGLSTIALTLAAAIASWFVVEKPAMAFKARLDRRRQQDVSDPPVPQAV
ncbi:acyltransferase family protein [Curtobacterium flaccumfaciens]|uniref:acyltransferase family protein n=1 Tax=Curtobacterium flaccumfaciens TaxID=2035 RepID=UPI001BDE406E|nr:acyltransferase [Curtobacterium flaccumfaciens]